MLLLDFHPIGRLSDYHMCVCVCVCVYAEDKGLIGTNQQSIFSPFFFLLLVGCFVIVDLESMILAKGWQRRSPQAQRTTFPKSNFFQVTETD